MARQCFFFRLKVNTLKIIPGGPQILDNAMANSGTIQKRITGCYEIENCSKKWGDMYFFFGISPLDPFFCPTLLAKATCSINLDHESYLIRTKQAHCSFLYSCLNQGPWLAKICFVNQTNFTKKKMRNMHKPAPSGLQDAFLMKWQRDCEVWGLASCINETVSHDTLHRSRSSCLVRIFNLNLGWKRCRSGKRKGDWW